MVNAIISKLLSKTTSVHFAYIFFPELDHLVLKEPEQIQSKIFLVKSGVHLSHIDMRV